MSKVLLRMERIKNEHIKEIMGVKEKSDIIDMIERKRLQWYGHVNTLRTGSFKLFKRPLPGFLTILIL